LLSRTNLFDQASYCFSQVSLGQETYILRC
jgi:hypothetical protein